MPDLPPQFVGAKLERPHPQEDLVHRPRLLEALEQWRDARVVLISAPPGYGKTTLAACWLGQDTMPPSAWLTLGPMENELERFATYFVAALRRIAPDSMPETESLLSLRNPPSPATLAEVMAFEMEAIERPAMLVLDDFEGIRSPRVQEFLADLVSNLPERMHLVILSRVDPSLPLSLWRSRRWMLELRAEDLRFLRDESRQFFAGEDGEGLSEEGVDTIHGKTEGWATGLRLAQLSLGGAADPEARVREFSASERLVTDYLIDEVLAGQPEEIREFLAVTSLLDRFNPDLCDALLAGSGGEFAGRGRDLLERVFRKNLFLVCHGQENGWYRYHHLFRQLLLERRERLPAPMPSDEVYERAAAWFRDEGCFEDCLKCHLARGELDEAADVFGAHLNEVIAGDPSSRNLFRLIRLFPAGAERGRLPLLVAMASLKALRTDCDGVADCLHVIDETCQDAEDERRRSWWRSFQQDLEWLRCFVAYWKGDIEGALRHGQRVIEGSGPPGGFAAMATLMYYGGSLSLVGRDAEYEALVGPPTSGPDFADGPEQWPYFTMKMFARMRRGELQESQNAALRLLPRENRPIPRYFESLGRFALGILAYERNQLDEAREHFLQVEPHRIESPGHAYHGALLGLARIGLAEGDVDQAERYAAKARAYAAETGSSLFERSSWFFDRMLAVAAGESEGDPALPPRDPDFMWLESMTPSFDWARAQVVSGSAEACRATLDFLDEAVELAEAHRADRRVVQLSAMRSLALDAIGRREDAVASLQQALEMGAEHGLVRSIADCGEGLRDLLTAVAQRHPVRGPVRTGIDAVAAALRKSRAASAEQHLREAGSPGTPADAEELTNRELDVLYLLHKRLSNKEIAENLGISAATVKMHTLNLYGKLKVHGRRQAVAAAIRSGIIDR